MTHRIVQGSLATRTLLAGVFAVSLCLVAACGEEEQAWSPSEAAPPTGERHSETTTVGPVTATVTVQPQHPRLGERVALTLEVQAEPEVEILMPAFGEQLGRFGIVDYTPRVETRADGGTSASQVYTLEPPMSGKQRIPPLLVEFIDNRPDAENRDDKDAIGELLTEELTVDVESVLPQGELHAELRPARGPLPPLPTRAVASWWLWASVAGGVVLVLALFGVWWMRRGRTPMVSAYELAMRQLSALERRGVPGAGEVDGWYVELSDIVRRFIERHYHLRAPELTTEEFLRAANTQTAISDEHRVLLRRLLERSDKVKFAAYVPREDESHDALTTARRFLEESWRASGPEQGAAP